MRCPHRVGNTGFVNPSSVVSRPASPGYLGRELHDHTAPGLRVAVLDATVPFAEVTEHEHREAHLVFVLRGAYASTAQHMPEAAAPLVAVANPPDIIHRDRFLTLPGRYLVVEIDRDLWHSAPARSRKHTTAHRMDSTATGLLLQLHHLLLSGARDPDRWAEERVLELCARATGCGQADPGPPPWLEQFRERLRVECSAPPSLTEAARDAGVHPTSLSRAFRRRYGMTISAWIRACRVERASALLHSGDVSLANTALATGFSDQAHLTRELQRAIAMTPSALRRRLKAGI